MRLILEDVSNMGYDFCNFIIAILKDEFKSELNTDKLKSIDNYYNEVFPHPQFNGDKYSALDILKYAMNNIVYDIDENRIDFHIDGNVKYKNYNVNIDTLCREITYGSMGVRGYPILLDVFNNVEKDSDKYIDTYLILHPNSRKGEDTE